MVWAQVLPVLHFKWVAGVAERLQHKVAQAEGQGRVDARSFAILQHLRRPPGGALDLPFFFNRTGGGGGNGKGAAPPICCRPDAARPASGAARELGLPCDVRVVPPHSPARPPVRPPARRRAPRLRRAPLSSRPIAMRSGGARKRRSRAELRPARAAPVVGRATHTHISTHTQD